MVKINIQNQPSFYRSVIGFGKRKKMCERASLFMQQAAVKQDKPGFTALCCHAQTVCSVGVSHLEIACSVKYILSAGAFSADLSPMLSRDSYAALFPRLSMW